MKPRLSSTLVATCALWLFALSAHAANPPNAITQPADNLKANKAMLHGTVTPTGGETWAYFEYRSATAADYTPAAKPKKLRNGTQPVAVKTSVSGLARDTGYVFRLVATNNSGRTLGNEVSFRTPPTPPIVTTLAASDIGGATALLNGAINPNAAVPATAYFEWGLTKKYGQATAPRVVNAGSTAAAVSQMLGGLTPASVYHCRLVASNAAGVVYGKDQTFQTAATTVAPVAMTQSVTLVAANFATLNGSVVPNGPGSATVWFEWGATTSYGNSTLALSIAGGSKNVAVPGSLIAGLVPEGTYHYRLVATNSGGTSFGADSVFLTPPLPPLAVTLAASSITSVSAVMNGEVDPKGSTAVTVYFEWGATTSYGNRTDPWSLSGTNNLAVAGNLTGLASGATYHFRLVATNTSGTSLGTDQLVQTPPLPPVVITTPATEISTNSATLNGTVNPNAFLPTTVWFEWGTTTNYGNTTPFQNVAGGTKDVAVSAAIPGLVTEGTYHYRLVATNSGGTSVGADSVVQTPPLPPVAVTLGVLGTPGQSTTLAGRVNANGASPAAAFFEWGTNASYGNTTPIQTIPGSTSLVDVIATITNLLSNTTYHFRMVATNLGGVSRGTNVSLSTPIFPPMPTTQPATRITMSSATLNGSVFPNAPVYASVYFQWGLTTNYGNQTPVQNVAGGTSNLAVTAVINGLLPRTTYHYRLVTQNSAGTASGMDGVLQTSASLPVAVVSVCDDASLREAMGLSTNVVFDCDGIITLTNQLVSASVTSLDAAGHQVTLSGGGKVPVIRVEFGSKLTIKGLTIANGYSLNNLGGAAGTTAGAGAYNAGELIAVECTFSNNVAAAGSAGFSFGGGIFHAGTSLRLTGCTFVNNSAPPYGGALAVGLSGNATATNCTFYGNTGGGVVTLDLLAQPCWFVNCTFAWNSCSAPDYTGIIPAGAIRHQYFGFKTTKSTVINSILAYSLGSSNAFGVVDGGYNLSTDACFTNPTTITNANPLLGPLADNDGPTWTMALLPGSPALDHANPSAAPATDQRGVNRPFGTAADIGAYEWNAASPRPKATLPLSFRLAPTFSNQGTLQLYLSGPTGAIVRLQGSTDLATWTDLATNSIGGQGFILLPLPSTTAPQHFYRTVSP